MIVLTRTEVEELLDLDGLIDALAHAHAELSAGEASMPPRIAAFAESGLLGAMPGRLPSAGLGCKLVSVFPHNADRGTHQAAIMLFDETNGTPVALMDGTYITAMRTAGAAALAAKLLARDDASTLAIVGTGVQARSHAQMFRRIRDFGDVRVAGRTPERATALAAEIGARACSFEEAVRGADVVAATTESAEPVVESSWLADGAHVSSVGFCGGTGSELDPAIVERAAVVCVEYRDTSFAASPAGAPELASVDREAAVELGELVSGSRPGRGSAAEITLYKSVGVAVQDLAAAALVLAAARDRGIGQEIELEGITG